MSKLRRQRKVSVVETEVVLTVHNAPDEWLESVDIVTTIPLGYAQLLVNNDRVCDALEADLKEFLVNKWKLLRPLTVREAGRQP
jgi:hypothetical protein